jgi:uncharacterized membrane protein
MHYPHEINEALVNLVVVCAGWTLFRFELGSTSMIEKRVFSKMKTWMKTL